MWGCWPGLLRSLPSRSSPAPGARSPRKGCSSRAPRWSPSAALTPFWRSSLSARSRPTAGSRPGTWCARLALAESTPGPLIMVVQFVAFLGAYAHPGGLDPWVAGVLGALLTTWVTFVPCFLFILLGAPYVERLRHNHTISAALTGITAAVVGVIANLALYFAVHTLFSASRIHHVGPLTLTLPELTEFRPVAAALTVVAFVLVFALRWPMLRVLAVCAGLGAAAALAGLPLS
ncbi:chromate transporter [Amycolatopsis plumensis]|uniref:chromate transporter n=1 Tax=Amycolatopsis plumensis TaxID=236508 RepID=UPI003617AB2C